MKVLVSAYSTHHRNAFARLLRRNHFAVSTAISRPHALKQLREKPDIDCLITEILPGKLPGKEFIEAIERETTLPLCRIIVVTRFHNVDNASEYLHYGCGAYMGLPVDYNRLLLWIRRILGVEPVKFAPVV